MQHQNKQCRSIMMSLNRSSRQPKINETSLRVLPSVLSMLLGLKLSRGHDSRYCKVLEIIVFH